MVRAYGDRVPSVVGARIRTTERGGEVWSKRGCTSWVRRTEGI